MAIEGKLRVYGSRISYYTGKLECYLRYRGIADEWLWRAAMHERWSHRLDREHASALLADELLGHILIPRAAKRWLLTRRQYGGFVRGDGVTDSTRAHVEQGVTRAYAVLERIFEQRRFLLGDRPSLADFGFMGPMFRHLSMDSTPADRMRAEAPGVYAWVARMWNARDTRESDARGALLDEIDEPIAALLVEACETHLVQLRENALAWTRRQRRYDQTIQGVRYEGVPVSRYRVWCLEALRRTWAALAAPAQATLREVLREAEAKVLWCPELPAPSQYDPEGRAPFNRAINVFGRGMPR